MHNSMKLYNFTGNISLILICYQPLILHTCTVARKVHPLRYASMGSVVKVAYHDIMIIQCHDIVIIQCHYFHVAK